MAEHKDRSIDEIMKDFQRINQEFREKRDGFKDSDSFVKLSKIEKMGREFLPEREGVKSIASLDFFGD